MESNMYTDEELIEEFGGMNVEKINQVKEDVKNNVFNKKDLNEGPTPASQLPNVYVSARDEADEEKERQLLIDQEKQKEPYEETVPADDADRL